MKKLYKLIESILLVDDPLISQLKLLRNLLVESLKSDEFRLNCIEALLSSIENWNDKEKLWNAPALFYHEQLKFSVRMIFWPAFYENNPHEHKTWSITGVFSNFLTINTYELLNSPSRLKKDRAIDAVAGEAGYLIPGCIHSVKNPTHELSGSIHIFNNIDILHPEENAIWYPAPRKYNLSNGLIERALTVCLASLCNINQNKSLEMIARIYDIAPTSVKLLSVKAMYHFDRLYARDQFERLEAVL
jgi:predicted metal-dependent enzyme (double-stranded beta helix superfamily)